MTSWPIERARIFAVVLTAGALVLGSTHLAEPATAAMAEPSSAVLGALPLDLPAGAACAPNDSKTTIPSAEVPPYTTRLPAVGEQRCIAESQLNTRSRLRPGCLLGPRALRVAPDFYVPRECSNGVGIGVEAIAQARAIAHFNRDDPYGAPSATGISPNVQWETVLPPSGLRPDIVLYNHNTFDGPVDIVEVKGVWNPTYASVDAQAQRYVTAFPVSTERVVRLKDFSTDPYYDQFQVRLQGECKNGATTLRTFNAYSEADRPGVISVQRATADTRCSDNDEPSNQQQTDEDEEHQPHPIPVPVDTINSGGSDNDSDDDPGVIDVTPEDLEVPICTYVCMNATGQIIVAGVGLLILFAAPELAALLAGYEGAQALAGLSVAAFLPFLADEMSANIFGDPHLATLDGSAYSFQPVGEFHLVRVPSLGIDVEGRTEPVGSSTHASALSAVAFKLNGFTVEMHDDNTVYVDGQATEVPDGGYLYFNAGAAIMRAGSQMMVFWPGHDYRPHMLWDHGRMAFDLPEGVPTTGVLGNNDGLPDNDLALANGTPLSTPSEATLDGSYADSWRITDAESLFTYGGGESTATFTDAAFPSDVVTLGDFTDAEVNAAAEVCNAEGVPAGAQFDDCLLDVALTGDETYATDASAVTDFLVDPAARGVDSAGELTEDYEGSIATNLRPISLEPVPSSGTAAGPIFDDSGYTVSVPSLPAHLHAAVSFDLYAFGVQPADGSSQSVSVAIDGMPDVTLAISHNSADVTSGPATVSVLDSGQSGQGPYLHMRVTVDDDHVDEQLRVKVASDGFRSLLGKSIAIDNLDVLLDLVPGQEFDVALGDTVSDGSPAAGAGRLETIVSEDRYAFDVPVGGASVYVNPTLCPKGITWALLDDATGSVLQTASCKDGEVRDLSPGNYDLRLSSGTHTSFPATYAFKMTEIPVDVDAGTMSINSSAKALTTSAPGQNASTTFAGTAGDTIQLATSSSSYPTSPPPTWRLLAPDGTVLYSRTGVRLMDTTTLPATGTYTFELDPYGATTGSMSVRAWAVPADVNSGH
jgi:von Willebrand factor type D domain